MRAPTPSHLPAFVAVSLAVSACGVADVATERTDWPMYRGDFAGTGYSSLAEITPANVATLARAWSYPLGAEAATSGDARPRNPNSQATPIVVGDVMYVPAADRVVAIDPVTGAERWRHPVDGGGPSRRGVAYWPGSGETEARLFVTSGSRLLAIDAASGLASQAFGNGGEIDLGIPYNSVPLVFENVVVVGANTPPGEPGGIGNARAYDARTGTKLWEFSSVAQPGMVGADTWAGDSWVDRLGGNAWPFYFTVDAELGLLYIPLAGPLPWPYGGDRGGANLYGNSVVAVDVATGEYAWHFQTIHHDLWDHDPPAPPVLFDLDRNGEVVRGLGVTTKSGYLYLLDRTSGEPLYGVEERPVLASNVPGELAFPTQPIPMAPPPIARVAYAPEDLVTGEDTSPEHAAACTAMVESFQLIVNQGPFTPWLYRPPDSPPNVTLLFPGLVGGPNWGGASYDPTTGYVFVFSQDVGSFGWMEDDPDGQPQPYTRVSPRPANFDVDMGGSRWPCQKPPWGRLTAVDAATGNIAWQRAVGITEGLPAEKQNTGRPGRAGAIATGGGVLFIASTDDARFRALDAATGQELWADRLDRVGNANPLTYRGADGRQYVGITATDVLLIYRLP